MADIIDGSFETPQGRKLFVSRRPDESSDDFVTRMMALQQASSDGHVLNRVLATAPDDWEIIPTECWLEAVNQSDPRLKLRLTTLESSVGGPVGHLVVECDNQQVADDWGDLSGGTVYLPRSDSGRIRTWQAMLWSLAHEIKGLGDKYDECLEGSGMIVGPSK